MDVRRRVAAGAGAGAERSGERSVCRPVATVEGRKSPGDGVRDACWVGVQVPRRCDVECGVLRAGPPADVQDSPWS